MIKLNNQVAVIVPKKTNDGRSTKTVIKKQPRNKIEFMGGVKGWYLSTKSDYKLIKNAIEFAQYKNKYSDRNWITVNNLWREVVNEKLILGGF